MNYYQNIIDDLEAKLFNTHPDAKRIYQTINSLKSLLSIPDKLTEPLVYDKNAPVSDKVLFAIRYLNRFCRVSDIEKVITKYEPDFNKGLSTPLRKLKDSGIIFMHNTTGSYKTAYYGLLSFFDENGQPDAEHTILKIDYSDFE